jgi:hypothetical protein
MCLPDFWQAIAHIGQFICSLAFLDGWRHHDLAGLMVTPVASVSKRPGQLTLTGLLIALSPSRRLACVEHGNQHPKWLKIKALLLLGGGGFSDSSCNGQRDVTIPLMPATAV